MRQKVEWMYDINNIKQTEINHLRHPYRSTINLGHNSVMVHQPKLGTLLCQKMLKVQQSATC